MLRADTEGEARNPAVVWRDSTIELSRNGAKFYSYELCDGRMLRADTEGEARNPAVVRRDSTIELSRNGVKNFFG